MKFSIFLPFLLVTSLCIKLLVASIDPTLDIDAAAAPLESTIDERCKTAIESLTSNFPVSPTPLLNSTPLQDTYKCLTPAQIQALKDAMAILNTARQNIQNLEYSDFDERKTDQLADTMTQIILEIKTIMGYSLKKIFTSTVDKYNQTRGRVDVYNFGKKRDFDGSGETSAPTTPVPFGKKSTTPLSTSSSVDCREIYRHTSMGLSPFAAITSTESADEPITPSPAQTPNNLLLGGTILSDTKLMGRALTIGADINVQSEYKLQTPLHIASENGSLDVVSFLCNREADVHAITSDGLTPLHCAAQYGHADVVNYLIAQGAHTNARTNELRETPLHEAAKAGHDDVVDILLAKGAKKTAKTSSGLTPAQIAQENGHSDLAEKIRRYGITEEPEDNDVGFCSTSYY